MATQLLLTRDVAGYPTTGSETSRKFSDTAQYFTLTASTVTNVTVPSGSSRRMMAHFSYASDTTPHVVFVQPSSAPALTLPTGTVAATTAELNPSAREVVAGQGLQFLTAQADVSVSITYYEIL